MLESQDFPQHLPFLMVKRFPLVLNQNILFYSLFSLFLFFLSMNTCCLQLCADFPLEIRLNSCRSYACHCKTSNLQEACKWFPKAPPFMSTHAPHASILLWLFWEVLLFHHGKRTGDLPAPGNMTSFPQSEVEIRCQSPKVKQSAVHLLCEMAERQGSRCEQVMPRSIYKHWRQKKKYKWFIWFWPTCQAGESCPKSALCPGWSLKLV